MSKRFMFWVVGFGALILFGCQPPTDVDIPVTIPPQVSPTSELFEPTPIPPEKTLIICVAQEPKSLFIYNRDFLYGGTGREANTVLQAIYDGPIDIVEGGLEPVILTSLPSLAAGSARFEPVEVAALEVYLNPDTLQADNLRQGDAYLPSGCHSPDCAQDYQGGTVLMDRMVVDFNLRQDVVWSDGVALTAGDSVFSYDLDRSGSTPTTKYMVDRTHSYVALDDQTVEWRGIPGYSDLEFEMIFWHPLPRHILGELRAEDLQTHQAANRTPVGWGAYSIEQWVEGDRIEAVRNPFYFRQDEGLPYFDRVIFRFLGSEPRAAIQQLLTTECDILDESSLPDETWSDLLELEDDGRLAFLHGPAGEVLRLEFNTSPVGRAGEAYFQTSEMRQAVAACLDRQGITGQVMSGLGVVANSFHNYSGLGGLDLSNLSYDPQRGKERIRFLGWVDDDEDPQTPQSGWGVPGVYNGKRLEVTLFIPDDEGLTAIAEIIQSELTECGFQLELEALTAEEITESFSEGVVFSRDFDMVLWTWPDWRYPLCEMYATREIPSGANPFGVNASGFSNPEYDQACDRLLLGELVDAGANVEAVQAIFIEQLPALPILQPPRVLAAAVDLCGVSIDPFSPSLIWDIEAYARGEGCN